VERSLAGAGGDSTGHADPLLEARRQAQTLLLLAWNLEERLLDLRQIDAGLRDSWSRLGESVSPAEEAEHVAAPAEDGDGGEPDGDAMAVGTMLSGLGLPEPDSETLPWRRMLEAFAVLAPGVALVTADAAIAETLREAGVPESKGAFEAPAWRLSGLDRCPLARPWLDVTVRLACVGAAKGGA
jgi:hypothetical protein